MSYGLPKGVIEIFSFVFWSYVEVDIDSHLDVHSAQFDTVSREQCEHRTFRHEEKFRTESCEGDKRNDECERLGETNNRNDFQRQIRYSKTIC